MALSPEIEAHLKSGLTSLCWCWKVGRHDGVVLGFTDHDLDLRFSGVVFRADTGMGAQALQQTTGLAVDNTEAVGALSSSAITGADILAGRYDGAVVEAWLVNWQDVKQRLQMFRGSLGEITRRDGEFRAELRGLTEALNQPQGRIYQKPCSAVLGDARCRFALDRPGYFAEIAVDGVDEARVFHFADLSGFADRWFESGRLLVLSGPAQGLVGLIKNDRLNGAGRDLELWECLCAEIGPGDMVRIEAGCDKRPETCKLKFNNVLNYRGFPDIPGEDWLIGYPIRSGQNTGGSLHK